MPPPLALALCSIFVIFLLLKERKLTPQVTRALWIPTIWMLYVASKPIGIWLHTVSKDPDAGSPMDRVFLTVLILFAVTVLVRRRDRWAGAVKKNPWLMLLIVYMLLSVLWSDIPGASFKRWVREFEAVLMALVVVSEPSPRRAMESVLRRTIYILIPFSLILIKYFPVYGVEYGRWSGEQMWIGVTQQKNWMALVCVISVIFILWSLFKRWHEKVPPLWKYQTPTELLILLLTVFLLGGPRHSLFYSATSTYSLLAGLGCSIWVYFRGKSRKKLKAAPLSVLTASIIFFGVVTVFASGPLMKFFAASAGRDATLTGRTEVWASLVPAVLASPILGHGFGGFWTSRTRDLYQISGAHSGYLDIILGTGLVGLILMSLFLLSICRKAHRELSTDIPWGLLWICYLVTSLVHNIGESSIDSFTTHLTAVLVFITVSSGQSRREEEAPREVKDEDIDLELLSKGL